MVVTSSVSTIASLSRPMAADGVGFRAVAMDPGHQLPCAVGLQQKAPGRDPGMLVDSLSTERQALPARTSQNAAPML